MHNLPTRRFSVDDLEMNGRIERDWIHLALVLIVPFAERRREGGRARSFYGRETRTPVDK
jgi:hypothetical protein